MKRTGLVAILAIAGLAVAGCGDSKVSADSLEKQVAKDFEAEVGTAPASVDCPDDLTAKVGESTKCTVTTADGVEIGATLTVASVDGDTARYNVTIDDVSGAGGAAEEEAPAEEDPTLEEDPGLEEEAPLEEEDPSLEEEPVE